MISIKLVIQSCTGYEEPLSKLLTSIDFKQHEEDIIVVKNAARSESVSKQLVRSEDDMGIVTVIETPKNIWEYASYQKVAEHMESPSVDSEYFLFLHDTTWARNVNNFWNGIEQFKKENPLKNIPNGFCYPFPFGGEDNGSFNMGFARKEFVMQFGMQFKGRTFTKKQGGSLEHHGYSAFEPQECDRVPEGLNGICKIGAPVVVTGGARVDKDGEVDNMQIVKNGARRKVVLIPMLDLLKAWVCSQNDNAQRTHPERP
jgi:hypothetical protein